MKIKKKSIKKLIKNFEKMEAELKDKRSFLTALLYQYELDKDKKILKRRQRKREKL